MGFWPSCHYYIFQRMVIGTDDIEALSTGHSGKESMRDVVEVKNHVQSVKLYVALYISECWEITGKTKFITDSLIKEKSSAQFYRVGVCLRTVVFDLGYQLWAELYYSHSFNQHCPAFLSLFSVIRSSFPGLRNSNRCFISPILKCPQFATLKFTSLLWNFRVKFSQLI